MSVSEGEEIEELARKARAFWNQCLLERERKLMELLKTNAELSKKWFGADQTGAK